VGPVALGAAMFEPDLIRHLRLEPGNYERSGQGEGDQDGAHGWGDSRTASSNAKTRS
jgi:hypothetical protein